MARVCRGAVNRSTGRRGDGLARTGGGRAAAAPARVSGPVAGCRRSYAADGALRRDDPRLADRDGSGPSVIFEVSRVSTPSAVDGDREAVHAARRRAVLARRPP